MKYKAQLLCGEIIVLLRANEGMLAAADRYCDSHLCLDLAEYVDWLSLHGLQARFCRCPGVKGFWHRLKLQKITAGANQSLRDRDAYITRDCVDPVRLQALTEEITQFFINRWEKEENTS